MKKLVVLLMLVAVPVLWPTSSEAKMIVSATGGGGIAEAGVIDNIPQPGETGVSVTPEQAIAEGLLKPEQIPYKVVAPKAISVRADSTAMAKVLGKLKASEEYPLLFQGKDWAKIQFGDKQGWISSKPKYVSIAVDGERFNQLYEKAKAVKAAADKKKADQAAEKRKARNFRIMILVSVALLVIFAIIMLARSAGRSSSGTNRHMD